jgi:pyruvate dehydrogenase E1 component alpha subunit
MSARLRSWFRAAPVAVASSEAAVSDGELVRRFADTRDDDAFAELVRRHGAMVLGVCRRVVGDHTTADDASRYRPVAELDAAWQREPLLRLRTLLERRDAWDAQREQALRADCAAQIDAAVQAYLAHPRPVSDAMFDHLFARLPAGLQEQRETARLYAADRH